MGLRQSRNADNYRYPYSSWGSSIDNVFCAPGKACGEEWTPPPSRSSSAASGILLPSRRTLRSRSADQSGEADVFILDDALDGYQRDDIITRQPMPTGSVNVDPPVESRPNTPHPRHHSKSSYRPSEYHPHYIDKPVKKKKIGKKRRGDVRPIESSTASELNDETNFGNRSARTNETYSVKESSRRHHRFKKPRTSLVLTSVSTYMTPADTKRVDGSSVFVGTRRVVPPRHKRGGEAPPHPFRIKGIPDDPYKRVKTADAKVTKL